MGSVPVTTGAPSYTSVAHFARGNALSLHDVLMQKRYAEAERSEAEASMQFKTESAYSLSYTNVADVFLPAASVPLVLSTRDLPSGAITRVPVCVTLPSFRFAIL
jgi:hypothetical protein